jgi:hypothetical protein
VFDETLVSGLGVVEGGTLDMGRSLRWRVEKSMRFLAGFAIMQ